MSIQSVVDAKLKSSHIGKRFNDHFPHGQGYIDILRSMLYHAGRSSDWMESIKLPIVNTDNIGLVWFEADRLTFKSRTASQDLLSQGQKHELISSVYRNVLNLFLFNDDIVCTSSRPQSLLSTKLAPSILASNVGGQLKVLRNLGIRPVGLNDENVRFNRDKFEIIFCDTSLWELDSKHLMSDEEINKEVDALTYYRGGHFYER